MTVIVDQAKSLSRREVGRIEAGGCAMMSVCELEWTREALALAFGRQRAERGRQDEMSAQATLQRGSR
jgi:hypothetical protein